MPWVNSINITSDLSNNVLTSYGDATGSDSGSPTYKGSGNTVNLSGSGTISGRLQLYDTGNNTNPNILNIGYHVGTGYGPPYYHLDGFEAGGSITGEVYVGRGFIYQYDGLVDTTGVIYAQNGTTIFTQMDGDGGGGQSDGGTMSGTVYMNGQSTALNIYQIVAGTMNGTINIGNASSTADHPQGIYYQGGGMANGVINMTGNHNLFWLNSTADYQAATTIRSGTVQSGSNLAVIDLNSPHGGGGFAMTGTLDLSLTTSGRNNLFFANGDILGAITTGGAGSTNYVYVGYVDEQDDNRYSWHTTAIPSTDTTYDLTGLSSQASGAPDIPTIGAESYININPGNQVRDTSHLNVKQILGGGGDLHVQVTAGNLYNLKGGNIGVADDVIVNFIPTPIYPDPPVNVFPFMFPTNYPENYYSPVYQGSTGRGVVPGAYSAFQYTTDFSNAGDYLVYSILNQDAINVGAYIDGGSLNPSPTKVAIGAIKDMNTDSLATGDYTNEYRPINLGGTERIPNAQDHHRFDDYRDNDTNYGPHDYGDWFDGHQAQITAGMVNVFAGSKLTIHPNYNEMGTSGLTGTASNIIGNLNIVGRPGAPADCNECGFSYDPADQAVVTLDRTTINTIDAKATITHNPYIDPLDPKHGEHLTLRDDYTANVVVGTNGILQGFGETKDLADHTPLRPNLVGDLAVLAGGMVRPYDADIFVVHGNALRYEAGNNPNDLYGSDLRSDYTANFEANTGWLKGVIMQVEGTTYFEHAARFSTRLFADVDGANTLAVVSDGADSDNSVADGFTPKGQTATVSRYWGDSLESTSLDFGEIAYSSVYLLDGLNNPYTASQLANPALNIPGLYKLDIDDKNIWTGVAQRDKVQYTPVFGFVNELKTKLEYKLYRGADESGEQTYYYQVAHSGNQIAALAGMDDANHLFNRDILFADMLGNWNFEKTNNDQGVVLRFRLVARHPQDGGIAVDQTIRNSREVAKKLDEIRYPFLTPVNMADPSLAGLFGPDPSLDGKRVENGAIVGYSTPYDVNHLGYADATGDPFYPYDGNPYDAEGFGGDIEEHYAQNQNRFGNYRDYWVHDIATFLHALQLEIVSGADIHRALRLLSAEPYASTTNANLAAMNMFIASRERNGVSASYLVEGAAEPEEETAFQPPLDRDMPAGFVANPAHVWTAALGGIVDQRRSGDEYGFRTRSGGVQLGAVKEIGDLYFGLTGAYLRSSNRWSELQARNTTDNYMGEALLGYRRGLAFIELSANAGYMDHKMSRNVRLGTYLNGGGYDPLLDCDLADNYYNGVYDVTHTGDYADLVYGGGIRLGYHKTFLDKWLFLPTIGVTYLRSRNTGAFTEDGPENAAFRLVLGKGAIERETLRVPVLLRLSRGIGFNNGGPWILTPEVRLGVTANLLDRGGRTSFRWVGNPIPERYMQAWGLEEERIAGQAGATLELSRRGRFYAAVNYDLNYANRHFGHSFSLQAGLGF